MFNLGAGGWHSKRRLQIPLKTAHPGASKRVVKTNPGLAITEPADSSPAPEEKGVVGGRVTRKWADENLVSTLMMQRYINKCAPACCGFRGRMVTSGAGDSQQEVEQQSPDVCTHSFSADVIRQL